MKKHGVAILLTVLFSFRLVEASGTRGGPVGAEFLFESVRERLAELKVAELRKVEEIAEWLRAPAFEYLNSGEVEEGKTLPIERALKEIRVWSEQCQEETTQLNCWEIHTTVLSRLQELGDFYREHEFTHPDLLLEFLVYVSDYLEFYLRPAISRL